MKIKLNSSFKFCVALFKSNSDKLNSGYVSPDKRDLSGLKALNKYIKEEADIKTTISKYMTLVAKDTKDINAMIDYYIESDERLSVQPNMCPARKTSKSKKTSSNGRFGGGGGGHSW